LCCWISNDKKMGQVVRSLLFIELLLLGFGPGRIAQAEVHEFVLDNGLKLLVKEDHRAPVVVSQVWYKVGSSYEHPGITGISHALEHMMFKGTKKHPTGDFSRIISENGGSENAFTGSDYTAYFQTLEKTRLPVSFELEADRMRNLTLPPEEFEKEIEVVKEERRWRTEDNPQSTMYEVMKATAFQTSPYRHPIIGWMHDLESMTVAELRNWYEKWYAPNNATLVVVGDVNAREVHALAEKYFAPLPASEVPVVDSPPEVAQQGMKRVVIKRPAELPHLLMAYKVPVLKTAIDHPDQVPEWEPYALEVLAGVLDGGSSARFASRLVRGQEIAAAISIDYGLGSRLDDVMVISAVPAESRTVAELEQAIGGEIEELKTAPVSDAELKRVKAQVVADDVYERDSIFYQGMINGILETVGLSWRHADEYVERIKAVTADQIVAVAKKYLVDDGLTVAELDPQSLEKAARQPVSGGSQHVH
jgi:zinc protease